jgi:hypothetical protein
MIFERSSQLPFACLVVISLIFCSLRQQKRHSRIAHLDSRIADLTSPHLLPRTRLRCPPDKAYPWLSHHSSVPIAAMALRLVATANGVQHATVQADSI